MMLKKQSVHTQENKWKRPVSPATPSFATENTGALARALAPDAARLSARDPGAVTPCHALQLQRTVGNRATNRLLRQPTATPSPTPPTPQPSVRQHVSTGQAPIQRLMVRMPSQPGSGTLHAVGEAEVDEVEQVMQQRGNHGAGGRHDWASPDWQFQPNEVNYFYGHGNRSAVGGVTPLQFLGVAKKRARKLTKRTAIKFVACGGGTGEQFGPAYGAAVNAELKRTKHWKGALKATEGLLFKTKAYKMAIPSFPGDAGDFTKPLADQADNQIRQDLWTTIIAAVKTTPPGDRKNLLTAFRNATAVGVGLNVDVPKSLSNKRLNSLREWLNQVFVGVALSDVVQRLRTAQIASNPVNNQFIQAVQQAAINAQNQVQASGTQIWNQFRDYLRQRQLVQNPNLVKQAGQHIGMRTPGSEDEQERFSTYQDFGHMSWKDWKNKFIRQRQTAYEHEGLSNFFPTEDGHNVNPPPLHPPEPNILPPNNPNVNPVNNNNNNPNPPPNVNQVNNNIPPNPEGEFFALLDITGMDMDDLGINLDD